MGLGAEADENRYNLLFATTSDDWDVTGAGWERDRIAVNTSSNDLHNLQPYLSTYTGGHCSEKVLFCAPLRHSYVSSAETPVDLHV